MSYHPSPAEVSADRISAASRGPKPPQSQFLEDTHLLAGALFLDDVDRSNMRMAAMRTRRMANNHGCEGLGCRNRNHRRDVAYLAHVLDIIGLPGKWPAPAEEDYAPVGSRGKRI